MKNYLFLIFVIFLACKAATVNTESVERFDYKIIEAPEFRFLDLGSSIDLGGITITRLEGNKAAIVKAETNTSQQATGTAQKIKDKSRTEININSNNKDKNTIKDKSRGDLDKSRVTVKVPKPKFLKTIYIFVLLGLGIIWFFYPKIKKMLFPGIISILNRLRK